MRRDGIAMGAKINQDKPNYPISTFTRYWKCVCGQAYQEYEEQKALFHKDAIVLIQRR